METNGREARRKKIREGEQDRMALITGRLQSLPSSPLTSTLQPRHAHTASTPSLPFLNTGPDGDLGDPQNSRDNDCITADPPLRKCESTIETRRPLMQARPRMPPMVNRMPAAVNRPPPSSEPSTAELGIFAPKQVISSIITSENTRAISSAMIALLVVLSNLNCRVFGRNIVSSESIMTSRPLYMLLLTDIIIVLGRLVLEKRRGFVKVGEGEKPAAQEDAQTFAGLVRLLETGFVAHQSLRALFNDFSIYAVVVVCGLSLL